MGRDRALVRDRKAHGMGNMTTLLVYIGSAIAALLVAFVQGKRAGVESERQKQATERQKAREVADRIDSDIGALPPNEAREALKKWSR